MSDAPERDTINVISKSTNALPFGRLPHPRLLVPPCVALAAIALALLTHDPVADGPRRQFAATLVQLLAGSLVFASVVKRQVVPHAALAALLGSLLVLAGTAIHFARLAHPLARTKPDVILTWRVGEPLPPEIEFQTRQASTVLRQLQPSELNPSAGASAALKVTMPAVPTELPWWAPVGASLLARSHHLVLVAISDRSAPYFTVINSGRLRVQLTSAGIMVTAPDGTGDVTEKTFTAPNVTDGATHRWELHAEPNRASIRVDGQQVWSVPRSAQVGTAFEIGDASGDREHGGSLNVAALSYQRVPVRTGGQ